MGRALTNALRMLLLGVCLAFVPACVIDTVPLPEDQTDDTGFEDDNSGPRDPGGIDEGSAGGGSGGPGGGGQSGGGQSGGDQGPNGDADPGPGDGDAPAGD